VPRRSSSRSASEAFKRRRQHVHAKRDVLGAAPLLWRMAHAACAAAHEEHPTADAGGRQARPRRGRPRRQARVWVGRADRALPAAQPARSRPCVPARRSATGRSRSPLRAHRAVPGTTADRVDPLDPLENPQEPSLPPPIVGALPAQRGALACSHPTLAQRLIVFTEGSRTRIDVLTRANSRGGKRGGTRANAASQS
jgi:hypothetical protein